MPKSILDAIREGIWDFEPKKAEPRRYNSTDALPGTYEKLDILAERVSRGLPLWHPSDRQSFNDEDVD